MGVVAISPRPGVPSVGKYMEPLGHYIGTIEGGRLRVPEGLAPPKLSEALIAYWPDELMYDAARVAYYESSWKWDALADTVGGDLSRCGERYYIESLGIWAQREMSAGYLQINVCAHGYTPDYWFIPEHNVSKAYQLYRESGWHPWTVTASGLRLI
jgi:hypothetical protein